MMKKPFNCIPILTITGSDSVGGSGVQADIKTISALGGYAASAITAITVQNTMGISEVYDLPTEIIRQQIIAVMEDLNPKVVKVGLLRNSASILMVSHLIDLYGPRYVVCEPGIVSTHGDILTDRNLLNSLQSQLFPRCTIVSLKCEAAAYLLDTSIRTTDDMVVAAQKLIDGGCSSILLQGRQTGNSQTDVLVSHNHHQPIFLSSSGYIDRNAHGIGGAFSASLATFLAQGEPLQNAVVQAREYVNRLVVYPSDLHLGHGQPLLNHTGKNSFSPRIIELYNHLMGKIIEHIKEEKEVNFYANQLNVTPRYLAEVTQKVAGKSPKEIIREHLINEIEIDLKKEGSTIQEIAYKFGFSSQAQLSKFFRQMRGLPPSAFRKI